MYSMQYLHSAESFFNDAPDPYKCATISDALHNTDTLWRPLHPEYPGLQL